MERFLEIVRTAIDMGATDIHLLQDTVPLYRIRKKLVRNEAVETMNRYELEGLLETLVGDSLALVERFETAKKLDLPFDVDENVRLRINASLASGVPVFSIRIIRRNIIDIDKLRLTPIVDQIKKHKTGLILITGKVNTGKTTTLNAVVQEINKLYNKKVVTLEEPIEYIHKSDKSMIVQKEVSKDGDVPTYYDGVINLLREDSDVAVIGEIRDRKTMDAVLDLAESGALVIGTLHTRSCGETVERIISMYEPNEQKSIKNTLSSVLKLVVSQLLVNGKDDNLVLVPEIMTVNSKIAALMRQDKFSISEIQDAIHHTVDENSLSFERAFTKLYNDNIIDLKAIEQNVDRNTFNLINKLIGGGY